MSEILQTKERVARKEHFCNYCGEKITKGERYDWAKLTNGDCLYEWKTHLSCKFIANELWSYIGLHNGMTEEDFKESCTEFCGEFICPVCNKKEEDCYYCLDKIYNCLKKNELTLAVDNRRWYGIWRLVPRESEEE